MYKMFPQAPEGGFYGIFNDSFPPILDGVTLAVENYVRWLKAREMEPCVVTPWNPVKTGVDYDVMRYFSLPIRSRKPYRYGYPKLDPLIWWRLRATPFKIAHSHCPFSSGRLAVYVKRHQDVPLVGTFHSKYKSDLMHGFRHAKWCVPIIMKRILNFFNACDEVWIPQAKVEETVREYGYKGPLTVVENGNDFASIISGSVRDYKDLARQRAGIPDDAVSLLFVGQHIWEKGLGIIVDALAALKGKVNFRMNFIGTGYAEADLRKKLSELGLDGMASLRGVITDRKTLSDYYAAADLFLFPSFYDNAPLVVREAAAMGTPTAIVRGSTASEVISDGRNGFVVEHDGLSYARLVERIAADRDISFNAGMEARNTIVRSWEDVVEEVADRYRLLIKNHHGKSAGGLFRGGMRTASATVSNIEK